LLSLHDALPIFSYVFPNLNANEQVQFYKKLKEDFERFNTIAIHWAKRDPQLLSQMLQNRTILKSLQFFTAQRSKRHVETEKDRTRSEEHTSELQSRENLVCR